MIKTSCTIRIIEQHLVPLRVNHLSVLVLQFCMASLQQEHMPIIHFTATSTNLGSS